MDSAAPATGEAIPLKPQITPLGEFFGMLAFSLFWNAFIGTFAYLAWHRGAPILARVIIGFFCFIGLLTIFAVIGKFLALFNPRIQLTARTNGVPLGGVFQFEWSIAGRAEKLRKIRITLEGREVATSSRGKNARTFTEIFADIPVLEPMDSEVLSQGQGRVTVPAGLMHTFNGGSNQVTWCLRVRGELARSGQVEMQYPINVLPSAVSA